MWQSFVKNQKRAKNSKQWQATEKLYKREGFGGVGPFPKGKQQKSANDELMSGQSSKKDMKPETKKIPILLSFWAPTTPWGKKISKNNP